MRDDLRVVIDIGQGRNEISQNEVSQAANLIRQYESDLKYKVYDFADSYQRSTFLSLAQTELLSEEAREWRMVLGDEG